MAANRALDASPPTNRPDDCPEARLDSLCTSPSTPRGGDNDGEIVRSGSLSLNALSPPDDKGQAPRGRKRGSSREPSSAAKTPCRKRQKALDTKQCPTLNTPPPTSPVSPSTSDAEPPALTFSDGCSDLRCPFCNEPIKERPPQKLLRGSYVPLQKRLRFCEKHREDKARDEWKERGYPNINWVNLDTRIAQHIDHLGEILRGKKSHFKDMYKQDIKSKKGQGRYGQSPGSCAGYYGTLGSRFMLEGIVTRLSAALQEMAEDRLVFARGEVVYVESVLVPELTVRFIMEDMGVGEERAREILEESRDVGEKLCVDEGDTFDENDPNWFWKSRDTEE